MGKGISTKEVRKMGVRKIGGSDTCWRVKTVEEKIAKIQELITRPIKWNIIRAYQQHGKKVTCELCGNEDYSGYWCKPCIHPSWCCECCLLLGVPNYATGVYIIGLKEEQP